MSAPLLRLRLAACAGALGMLMTASCGAVGSTAQVGPASASPSPALPTPASRGRLVWADEFDGRAGAAPDARYWTPVEGAGGGGQLQTYTSRAANVSLDGGGHLQVTARREPATGVDGVERQFSSARISTAGRVEPRNGTIEARLQLPSGRGLWPAFWLLGANYPQVGWPAAGEIDVMESRDEAHRAFSYVHYPAAGSPDGAVTGQRLLRGTAVSPGWHTYTLTWTADSIVISIDGQVCLQVDLRRLPADAASVFTKPFSIVLNVAVGGAYPAAVEPSTPFPATLLVDYVRVYAPR